MAEMFSADDLDTMQLRALRLRSVRALQSGQGVSHAAALRRGARSLSRASARARRPGRAILMTVLEPRRCRHARGHARRGDNERLAVVPQGAGTRRGRGAPPARADAMLSLAGLPRDIEHCGGDLTATLSAGVTLAEVNARLAQAGQWLPLDPLCRNTSTIGGMVAANESGPARHRYGAPRDLIIGVDLALADGRLVKAGGRVVKNVAGYDLGAARLRILRLSRRGDARDLQAGAPAAPPSRWRSRGRAENRTGSAGLPGPHSRWRRSHSRRPPSNSTPPCPVCSCGSKPLRRRPTARRRRLPGSASTRGSRSHALTSRSRQPRGAIAEHSSGAPAAPLATGTRS